MQTVEKLLVYCSFFYHICCETVFIVSSAWRVSKQFICYFSAPIMKVNSSFSISENRNKNVSSDSPEECTCLISFITSEALHKNNGILLAQTQFISCLRCPNSLQLNKLIFLSHIFIIRISISDFQSRSLCNKY